MDLRQLAECMNENSTIGRMEPAENVDEIDLAIRFSNVQIVMERFKMTHWNLGAFLEACREDGVDVICDHDNCGGNDAA
jgi:hypothetical protein